MPELNSHKYEYTFIIIWSESFSYFTLIKTFKYKHEELIRCTVTNWTAAETDWLVGYLMSNIIKC